MPKTGGKASSPLTDSRPPKPANQGDAKMSGPGSGTPKAPVRGGNSQAKPGMGGLRTDSITKPGKGTSGTAKDYNRVSRT